MEGEADFAPAACGEVQERQRPHGNRLKEEKFLERIRTKDGKEADRREESEND
jgi:ribosomal protein L34